MTPEAVSKKILKSSVVLILIFTFSTLVVAYLTASQVILFDGLSNFVGVTFTIISIAAIKFIEKRDIENYPFGKEIIDPFVAIIQFITLFLMCVATIINSVQMIFDGGHEIDIASGVLFGLISTIFKIGAYMYLKFLSKNHSTPIAESEVVGWKFEVVIGVGILLGFVISWILSMTTFTAFIPYVDPVLTILVTLIFSAVPIVAISGCMKELLQARPQGEIEEAVNERIEKINLDYDFSDKVMRLGKVGGKVIVEIDYIIKEGSKLDSVSEQDQMRSQLTQTLAELPYRQWVNVNFTSDIKFTIHIS